ncbi:ATP-binding cassette domain-containing protein [Mycoplasmopsis bovirhinis]|uniref:Simple sugar ABC transporter ATP-binding protein,P59-like protein n=1 Tax=Mycoplasmopsis bovirhinis TaxID=29553 RepID=A0A449AEU7_9BACT|nr:ATP-binding cassette domain-containing protein [Mycoplasmopsis bovirhinis]VEU63508.1 simple sugar ABC transporter ATP-binding protein,P59-like protein [Mycoplasmopsis bovirhinis]
MEKINAIEFVNISKSFGTIKANQEISFEVEKGTIHALIGENGAGKSTLMSILFGLYSPDTGVIKVNNNEVLIKGPNDANALGIGMVHQHFKLVDVYTNLENIALGSKNVNKITRIIDFGPAIRKIKTIQNKFDLHFDLNKLTGTETVATQQKVEIMKMLYRDSEILIFDEPTAVLTDQEIQGLLNTFKLFKQQGKTILFISHKLGEIKEVADNATVIRHGRVTGNFAVKDVSIEEMANRMVGGEVENARNQYTDTSKNKIILDVQNVSTEGEKPLKNISLQIRSGEIVAIAGVEGNGQTDLEYVISGMKKPSNGIIRLTKTPLIKEKLKIIQKANKTKTYFSVLMFFLTFIAGTILMVLTPEAKDINVIYKIIGGFLYAMSAVFFYQSVNSEVKNRKKLENIVFCNFSSKVRRIIYLTKITYLVTTITLLILWLSAFILKESQIIPLVTLILLLINGILMAWNLVFIFKALHLSRQIFDKNNLFHHICVVVLNSILYIIAFIILVFLAFTNIRATLSVTTNNIIYALMYVSILIAAIVLLMYFYKWELFFTKVKQGDQDKDEYLDLQNLSVYEISKLGLSFIPSDRHKHGLVLDYNIKYNTVLRRLWDSSYVKFGIFNEKAIKEETKNIINKYDVRGARNGISQARQLSGGNQQKFIVGREMNSPHDFILIVQPTRGLDVGAIKNIHEQILEEKKNGKAILLISYELDEVLALADKIAVINTGEILAVKEAKDLTRTEIGIYMAHKNEEKGIN